MAATPAMLPLTLATAPLKVGEAAPEALPEVLLAAGVEVAAGVEPEPAGVEPEAGVEAAAEEEVLLLPVAEAELEVSVAEAEEELLEEELELELEVSTGGTEMGWPAEEHCWTTALETEIWSATSQAFWTQGVMVPTRAGFWQWQAKSVRDEQPSVVRAVTKQLSEQLGTLGS